jgi:hypothetical protein
VAVAVRLVEDPPVVKTTDVEGAMVGTEEDVSVEVGFVEVGGTEDEDGFEDDVDGGKVVAGMDVVDEVVGATVGDGSCVVVDLSVALTAGSVGVEKISGINARLPIVQGYHESKGMEGKRQ